MTHFGSKRWVKMTHLGGEKGGLLTIENDVCKPCRIKALQFRELTVMEP